MEFACGFVFVPPPRRSTAAVIKRSALQPPANWNRPRTPPPPPPPPSASKDKSPKTLDTSPKIIEQSENNKDVKRVTKTPPFYQNLEFLKKHNAFANSVAHQQTTPSRKTALLPPHLKPAATMQSIFYNPPIASLNSNSQVFSYDLPKDEPDSNVQPRVPNSSHAPPEGTGSGTKPQHSGDNVPASVPPLPPRPPFMSSMPEYLVVLPSSQKTSTDQTPTPSPAEKADDSPLQGNPNVVLVSLGKLLSEERVPPIEGAPTCCSQCGSVLDTCYEDLVNACCFCQTPGQSVQGGELKGYPDGLFLLNPQDKPVCTPPPTLIFCIDISGSMSINSEVSEGEYMSYKSRLQFVQEAVIQCVQRLSKQQPDIRVGLISFNFQVTMHGYGNVSTRVLRDAELIESSYLKNVAASFPSPPPLSQTRDLLQRQVMALSPSGTTALGPAALLAIAMASRQSGSKVIICTDGKANTDLGNLEVEDNDARTLLSSTIFYQDLGEYAANQGVTVSVLTIEGTDCRLDELGRLADRTRGKVVIAHPNQLHPEFEQIIENRTIATHCSVTLVLPKSLRMRGEREAGHKASREVGNVDPDTEITFQFGAFEQDAGVAAPAPGSRVSIQLQIRYRKRNGQMMLRVHTAEREVTDHSATALSSLSVAVIQLHSSQASAALAVRGRFHEAKREGEVQRKLVERAIEHNRNADDRKTYQKWVKAMEPIYNNIHNFTRRETVTSESQSLTDAEAVLLYNMKHSNRKSLKNKQTL